MNGSAVRVTNTGEEDLQGRYNGVDYNFEQDEPQVISHQAANHIFGYGMDDKTGALTRLGWVRSTDEYKLGMQRLGKIKFEEVVATFQTAPVGDASPLRPDEGEPEGGQPPLGNPTDDEDGEEEDDPESVI